MPSSVISDFSYDEAKHELLVTFVTGRRYLYEDVPPEVITWLNNARSKGKYFNRFIRDAYSWRELEAE
jgi:hypothetical protein